MPGTKMPAPYLPSADLLQMQAATWGPELVNLNGDVEQMLEGIRDYIFTIQGDKDISIIVRDYFKQNGYDFNSTNEEEEEDW